MKLGGRRSETKTYQRIGMPGSAGRSAVTPLLQLALTFPVLGRRVLPGSVRLPLQHDDCGRPDSGVHMTHPSPDARPVARSRPQVTSFDSSLPPSPSPSFGTARILPNRPSGV